MRILIDPCCTDLMKCEPQLHIDNVNLGYRNDDDDRVGLVIDGVGCTLKVCPFCGAQIEVFQADLTNLTEGEPDESGDNEDSR